MISHEMKALSEANICTLPLRLLLNVTENPFQRKYLAVTTTAKWSKLKPLIMVPPKIKCFLLWSNIKYRALSMKYSCQKFIKKLF